MAAVCFAATFRGPQGSFWSRMTTTGALLGALALRRRPELLNLRLRPRHLVEGTAIAAGLHLIFRAGDRVARRVMPQGAQDISAIYELGRG